MSAENVAEQNAATNSSTIDTNRDGDSREIAADPDFDLDSDLDADSLTSAEMLQQVQQYTRDDQSLSQVTSITQLSDVQPTDWAYQALQSLVERYGCIVGYPDGTYRGNRALTRFEFAAGLNACLDRISELLAASTADLATREDLAALQRLQEEFAAELAALREQVDSLDGRIAEMEANQFSTTTKLAGETLFFVSDVFGDEIGEDNVTNFQYRVRLNFDTSFNGRDQLRARLQAGTLQPFTQPGFDLGYGAFANTSSNVVMDNVSYIFPLDDIATVGIYANATGLDDITFGNTINPLDNPARSAISRFGQRNAVYRTANTSAGAAVNLFLTEGLSLQVGYLAGEASDPNPGSGLFNGNYGLLGQLTARNIFDVLDIALTYVNAYTGTSVTSTGITAGVPFGVGSRNARVDVDRPVIANSYGVTANLRLFPGFQLGGWVGLSDIRAIGVGDADVWNYAVTLAFPDLGGQGNLGGIIVGMQPRLTGTSPNLGERIGRRSDPDVGVHIEAFYRIMLNDRIDITPGIIWLTAPNHDNSNDDAIQGVLRTTFRF
ncbi:MAG: carbohydrate porin [Synechococcales cyanobacterium C42_A2020_086]|nr:carbohydrate porin [Synechococcales cyanobacterium C42_A2020_086]